MARHGDLPRLRGAAAFQKLAGTDADRKAEHAHAQYERRLKREETAIAGAAVPMYGDISAAVTAQAAGERTFPARSRTAVEKSRDSAVPPSGASIPCSIVPWTGQ